MNITRLRWTILSLSCVVLLFGGIVGLSLGFFLPTFACPYVGTRGGDCFLMSAQFSLGSGNWESYKIFGERVIYFSILVIVIGRVWCGWICPLGFFMDIMDLIRSKLRIGYIRFPERVRNSLGCIKWIFLSILILFSLWIAFPYFAPKVALDLRRPYCQLCPARCILPLVTGNPSQIGISFKSVTTIIMTSLGLAIAIITIIGAFFNKRFFCPYCPMGLMLSWYRKISFIKLKKDIQKCTLCEICYNVCPLEIQEVYKEREKEDVTFDDCILCLRCVEYCPEDNALRAAFLGKTIYRSTGEGFFKRQNFGKMITKQKEISSDISE